LIKWINKGNRTKKKPQVSGWWMNCMLSSRCLWHLRARPAAGSTVEERGQSRVERFAGAYELVINLVARAAVANIVQKLMQRFEVPVPQGAGIAVDQIVGFHAVKPGWSAKLEIQLIIV
jgi:hypothetical protein